jgi:leucyl aminopeptidase (aminopeptidase T)
VEFALGTETLRDYLSFEVAAAAQKLVRDVMLVKPGEDVAITADTASDARVVDATAKAAYAADARPVALWYQTTLGSGVEPPRPVAGAIVDCDVWIEYAVGYTLYSNAFRRAIDRGVRYICLSGMDAEMMVRTVGRVDYRRLVAMGEKLRALMAGARKVQITTPAGTDISADNSGRFVRHSGKLADTPGEPIMLGGQISWSPLEESINGRLVFDATIWPPAEIGLVRTPVALTVEAGVITRVEGGAEARIYERWLASFHDPNMYRVAHYSLGFNPGVTRPTGRIVEDERLFGCLNVGIGTQGPQLRAKGWKAAAHTDGVGLNPTIHLDGEPLEVEGRYVHPEIVAACREMEIPGY